MKQLIKILFIVYILTTSSAIISAEEISPAFMPESEDKEVVYVDKKTGEERSRLSISLRKISRDDRIIYQISSRGKGDYDKYEDVTWETSSEMEEKQNLLYTLQSTTVIKEKTGQVSVMHKRRFDYNRKKIFCSLLDADGNIIEEKILPLKGLTTDSATMTYVLKTYIARRNEKKYRDFYLLSDKEKLYRVTIKEIGTETLDLPSGKVESIKLRLIPNLGILTGMIGSLIPPTYVWYIDEPPCEWLQYQGLETGIGSTHIRAYLN
ncbi:MAG: DUF3108 domain-containing protein [Candidatus Omnitrophica bacterium]|nr:DUF3108 domain-containing protein [Candidatus Omnitrophota bacterium]